MKVWFFRGSRFLSTISDKEDIQARKGLREATACNRNFFAKAAAMGLNPTFVHTDKDRTEINAAKVYPSIQQVFALFNDHQNPHV